jgi:hypothetical protein
MENLTQFDGLYYVKDGKYYVNLTKYIPNEDFFDPDEDTVDETEVYDVIAESMSDGEIRLAFDDDSEENENGAFLFYKSDDKFFVDYLYADKDGEYLFNNDFLYWFTNYHREMTVIEETDFLIALQKYIEGNDLPLSAIYTVMQQRKVANKTVSAGLDDKKQDNYKLAAQIIKASGAILGLILALVFVSIKRTALSALFGFGLGFGIFSVVLFISILCKFRFAFCVVQLLNKHKMTPDEMNWAFYPSIEKYFKPIWYAILSAILIAISFI